MADDTVNANPVTGIIIVDHGSRRAASNDMLLVAVDNFLQRSTWDIVELAHMELAQPDIATAFRRCVERGAQRVIVFPYFLSPGRHWNEDIPNLVRAAASGFPDVDWLVTAPFGLHRGMSGIISDRISQCLKVAHGGSVDCDVCGDGSKCQLQTADSDRPPTA